VLTLGLVWFLVAAFLLGVVVLELRDRRWRAAAFWGIVAAPFAVGDRVLAAARDGTHWPAQLVGAGVIALALLASRKRARAQDDAGADPARVASAERLGNRLFVPALAIPVITLALVLGAKLVPDLIDPAQKTLIALALACVIALGAALLVTRSRPKHALAAGKDLLDALGWAAVLPMMLATLGTVFAETGVGDAVTRIVSAVIPIDSAFACLVAYALGMVAFTAITGNAFAAFPVMTAGIGLPLLVGRHGADPAALGAIGMVTGYCGTLLTPMAANFNLVPVILLDLHDDHAVIRAQMPTAVVLLVVNIAIMGIAVFR
jgi:uncharacterized membrane protein